MWFCFVVLILNIHKGIFHLCLSQKGALCHLLWPYVWYLPLNFSQLMPTVYFLKGLLVLYQKSTARFYLFPSVWVSAQTSFFLKIDVLLLPWLCLDSSYYGLLKIFFAKIERSLMPGICSSRKYLCIVSSLQSSFWHAKQIKFLSLFLQGIFSALSDFWFFSLPSPIC